MRLGKGYTYILCAASLCWLQLASADESPTEKQSESDTTKQSTTAHTNPLQTECSKVKLDMVYAIRNGVGMKTYFDEYKDIESSIAKGEPLDKLKERLLRLSKALQEQNETARALRAQRAAGNILRQQDPNWKRKVNGADVDFGHFMADLQRKIKRHWNPPRGEESKRVAVVFKVFRNGEIKYLRILSTSGLDTADSAALKAVELAQPFENLPPGSPKDVDIEFTFDYNVFNRPQSKP